MLNNKTELMIQISYLCNLSCIHCAYGDIKNSPVVDLDKVKDFLNRNNPEIIKISGGEPTLSDIFGDIVKLSKDTGSKVVSFTNGLSNPSINPDFYWVSVYGDKKVHNSITRASTFNKTMKFVSKHPVEYLNSPVFNKKQMKSLIGVSESLNIPLRITQLLSHGRPHEVLSTKKQIKIIEDLHLNNGWNWVTCSLGFEEPRCKKKACLKPDGTEVLCTYIIRGLNCPFMNRRNNYE